jgi:hypothetical protein
MQKSWIEERERRWMDCPELAQVHGKSVEARWSEGSGEVEDPSPKSVDGRDMKHRVAVLQRLSDSRNK